MEDILAFFKQRAEVVYILAYRHLRCRSIGALADILIKLADSHSAAEVIGV